MPKSVSTFFPEAIRARLQQVSLLREIDGEVARWWRDQSYAAVREQVFSPNLKRSWFVLSSGNCPSCGGSVPMYDWEMDPLATPWKVQCPRCREHFPKNDFLAYYRSGMGPDGRFDPSRADPSLLVNEAGDSFGVDDGNGFIGPDGSRWLFIAAYLVHGHWIAFILPGLEALAFHYVLTGDREYARRALILLYQLSRSFLEYNWREQGVMYEKENNSDGSIGYWAQTANDLPALALVYDRVFDVADDPELTRFLEADGNAIQESIEQRIFREAQQHPDRYTSNPPSTENADIIMEAVLGWPDNRERVLDQIGEMIALCTKVDGLVGEKGLPGYAAIGPRGIANLLLLLHNADPDAFEEILRRFPVLHRSFRFHIDTWYRCRYYPGVGDSGSFGGPNRQYAPLANSEKFLRPDTHTFEWFLQRLAIYFEDPDFHLVLYLNNGRQTAGLFQSDPLLEAPADLRQEVDATLSRHGPELRQISKLFSEWRLALLYSGSGTSQRLFWMNYDSGANHANHEALNIGMFAYGLNLMSTFGYPPVSRGGWSTPEFNWYRKPASHNLVVIDGQEHTNLPEGRFIRYPEYGKATLLGAGGNPQIVVAEAPEYAGVRRYERLCLMVDADSEHSYVLDCFRVEGGEDQAFFLRSCYATLSAPALNTQPAEPYGHGTFMRDFHCDPNPVPGFHVDFELEDRFQLLDPGPPVHLRYHSLTPDASASLCQSWVDVTNWQDKEGGMQDAWIPTLMLRKSGPSSAFIGVLEPYRGSPFINAVRESAQEEIRGYRRIEVHLHDGAADLLFLTDRENPVEALGEKAPQAFPEIEIPIRWDGATIATLRTSALCVWVRIRDHAVEKGSAFGGTMDLR